MVDGARKGVAPCGHPGTHVTVNFVTCDRGCDAVPQHVDPERTEPIRFVDLFDDGCPKCLSDDVEPFAFHGAKMHCCDCGAVW